MTDDDQPPPPPPQPNPKAVVTEDNDTGKLEIKHGYDSSGTEYETVDEMWKAELSENNDTSGGTGEQPRWYAQAAEYWEDGKNCEANVNGVLGGYAVISPIDVQGSSRFLRKLQSLKPSFTVTGGRAVDCGAGIGRISKQLLLPRFESVDLVEQSKRLIDASPEYIGENAARVGKYLNCGLQEFHPDEQGYDCIWIQWVIGHLTDSDMVAFLLRCQSNLRPGGLIVVKENNCVDSAFVVDKDDSSVTRSVEYFKKIFAQASLRLVAEERQRGFPEDIFPVTMFALE